jgi:hypothetical protein
LECTAALAAELDRAAVFAVDGVGGGQAAHGILSGHLAGGDAPGLKDLLTLGHNQGTLASQSLLSTRRTCHGEQQGPQGQGRWLAGTGENWPTAHDLVLLGNHFGPCGPIAKSLKLNRGD